MFHSRSQKGVHCLSAPSWASARSFASVHIVLSILYSLWSPIVSSIIIFPLAPKSSGPFSASHPSPHPRSPPKSFAVELHSPFARSCQTLCSPLSPVRQIAGSLASLQLAASLSGRLRRSHAFSGSGLTPLGALASEEESRTLRCPLATLR